MRKTINWLLVLMVNVSIYFSAGLCFAETPSVPEIAPVFDVQNL